MGQYYDRKSKEIIDEQEYKKEWLDFLYNTSFGRILLKVFIARPCFSKIIGLYHKTYLSKTKIKPFVKKYKIQISDKELKSCKNFNDFFTRKRNYKISSKNNELVSPADAKLFVYKISDDLILNIKRSKYSVADIIQNNKIATYFKGGTCLVYRLSVNDNHRYNYIDKGKNVYSKYIKGQLHTIRPISDKYNVFAHNARAFSLLKTDNLGYVGYVEVGALLVGKIHNHNIKSFRKNDEKGYFKFGGSTIVILLNKNIRIDEDILNINASGLEVQVKAGERVGLIC